MTLLEVNDMMNSNYIYDITQDNSFEKYINFIFYIKQHLKADQIYFFDLYENYNMINNINLFNLDNLEYKKFVALVTNYRLLNNNKII